MYMFKYVFPYPRCFPNNHHTLASLFPISNSLHNNLLLTLMKTFPIWSFHMVRASCFYKLIGDCGAAQLPLCSTVSDECAPIRMARRRRYVKLFQYPDHFTHAQATSQGDKI